MARFGKRRDEEPTQPALYETRQVWLALRREIDWASDHAVQPTILGSPVSHDRWKNQVQEQQTPCAVLYEALPGMIRECSLFALTANEPTGELADKLDELEARRQRGWQRTGTTDSWLALAAMRSRRQEVAGDAEVLLATTGVGLASLTLYLGFSDRLLGSLLESLRERPVPMFADELDAASKEIDALLDDSPLQHVSEALRWHEILCACLLSTDPERIYIGSRERRKDGRAGEVAEWRKRVEGFWRHHNPDARQWALERLEQIEKKMNCRSLKRWLHWA